MKITMYPGRGGNAFVFSSANSNILVSSGTFPGKLPVIDALIVPRFDKELYSLIKQVGRKTPVYTAKGTAASLKAEMVFDKETQVRIEPAAMTPKKKFKAGVFAVTPHLVDHCAYDSLALSIEADGNKIFISVDPRGNCAGGSLFKRVTAKAPERVDCLLLDGIHLDEGSLPNGAAIDASLAGCPGAVLMDCGLFNADVIAAIYKACRKAGRILVIDLKTAFVLSLMRNISDKVPQPHWPGVRVRFSGEEAGALQDAGYRELLHFIGSRKIDVFEMRRKCPKLAVLSCGAKAPKDLRKDLAGAGEHAEIEYVPSRCAPSRADLRLFAEAMKPKSVAATFPEAPEILSPLPVSVLKSGESVEIQEIAS